MNLKTLKDISPYHRENKGRSGSHLIEKDQLRDEAVKWVKNCKRPVDFTRNDRCGVNQNYRVEFCEVCQDRMKFFNLTEEDLK